MCGRGWGQRGPGRRRSLFVVAGEPRRLGQIAHICSAEPPWSPAAAEGGLSGLGPGARTHT